MLHIALRFHEKGRYESHAPTESASRRKPKVSGYQLVKSNYRILRLLVSDQVTDIPRARIVEYQYVTVAETVRQQGNYFILPVTDSQLSEIEGITKTERQPSVYLWRDDQWWSFPQLEMYNTGEMTTMRTTIGDLFGNIQEIREHQIEKTGLRIRATYEPSKGPGFELTRTKANIALDAPTHLPTTITGHGMVLAWKQGYPDKPCCWWMADENPTSKSASQTYKHRHVLKSTPAARWSKTFKSWYYAASDTPPQSWLELVGYQSTSTPPTLPPDLTVLIEKQLDADQKEEKPVITDWQAELEQRRERAAAMRCFNQYQAQLKMQTRFLETLHCITQHKALPAQVVILADPWS